MLSQLNSTNNDKMIVEEQREMSLRLSGLPFSTLAPTLLNREEAADGSQQNSSCAVGYWYLLLTHITGDLVVCLHELYITIVYTCRYMALSGQWAVLRKPVDACTSCSKTVVPRDPRLLTQDSRIRADSSVKIVVHPKRNECKVSS